MKIIKRLLYFFGGLILLGVLIFFALCTFLCTDKAQQWLFEEGIKMLSEHLETKVKADSIIINPWKGQVTLYGFYAEDRNTYPMLKIDTLHAGISLPHLLNKEVMLDEVKLYGADATLYKAHSDSAANYQFAVDALKPKKKNEAKTLDGKEKKKFKFTVDVKDLDIRRLHLKWDVCDKQLKYIGKPNRGHFDANHINADMDLHASVKSVRKDSFNIDIDNAVITDYASGLKIKHLEAKARVGKGYFSVPEMNIDLARTKIRVADVKAQYEKIPADTVENRKVSMKMKFEPFDVTADVILKDISKPFAPALSHFTTPLTLSTKVSGTLEKILFRDIFIATPDNRLTLKARGEMTGITLGKGAVALHFRNIDLKARNNVKEEIIMHFAKKVRLKMLRQMKIIGNIGFLGSLDILYKKEIIDGVLFTSFGNVSTRFTLNGRTRFMSGYMSTTGLELGKVMGISALGPVNAHANFNFNISKKVKRPASALPHGRLPIGSMRADIKDVKFKFVHFKQINAAMESDGSTASGSIIIPQKIVDFIVDFDYIQTDSVQNLKVHPSLTRHRRMHSAITREERRIEREQIKEAKEKAREEKKRLKEERKRLKEERKKANEKYKKEKKKLTDLFKRRRQ